MRSTRLRSSRSALLPIFMLVAALIFWPTVDSVQRHSTSAQSVSWLSSDSISYLTSSGVTVMVPSWLPGPVAGTAPEIYAGGGSYSIYFYSGSSFLYITGVAGGGFPGGSEANLNVELTVNASVLGYPAIQDIGIPEGSDTPIYDKVMWIADGVLYTVSGNGLDSDSLSLANSSVALYAPEPTSPPVVEEPPVPEPDDSGEGVVEEPSTGDSSGDTSTGGNSSTGDSSSVGNTNTGQNTSVTNQTSGETTESNTTTQTSPSETGADEPDTQVTEEAASDSGAADDGTGGPWYTGSGVGEEPSDGTSGAVPPFYEEGDGTGGPP